MEVFVAILPCSQYTYVQACMSQKRVDLTACCVNALRFHDGVSKAIIPDNLKSVVNRANKYEADINQSFKDFARHYNCVINTTRGYSPQDKALVENAVQLAYQRIYYPLREMTFSLEDLNKEIGILLERYNNFLFRRKESSHIELFQPIERQYLKALPSSLYEIKDHKRAKVQKMGYMSTFRSIRVTIVFLSGISVERLRSITPEAGSNCFYHQQGTLYHQHRSFEQYP